MTFRTFLHLHQHQSSRDLHLQYFANNQSTQCCQSLITQGSDHPPVLEPHMVLKGVNVYPKANIVPLPFVFNNIYSLGCLD
jgi:hypothetical protein